jgi:hypothetical protein
MYRVKTFPVHFAPPPPVAGGLRLWPESPLAGPNASPVLALILFALSGCSLLGHTPQIAEPIKLIAVMPIERAETAGAALPGEKPRVEPGAERVITAQIYAVLSESPRWRFVPDLTVAQALGKMSADTGDLATRARAMGKAVGADAVLFGTVSRYVERVGSEYGAQKPAAVGFTLQLISVPSGRLLWIGRFDQQQEALSTNLFNWWQFWRGGPKWFTAQQFAHLGVERLLEDLDRRSGEGTSQQPSRQQTEGRNTACRADRDRVGSSRLSVVQPSSPCVPAAQHLPATCVGLPAPVDQHLAIDNDVLDAGGALDEA